MKTATPRLTLAAFVLVATTAFAGVDAEVGNGDKITGTLSPASEVETFRVRVPNGAKISVKAKSAKKGPALHVVLLPPSAAALGTADGKAPSISAVAPTSGLYAVAVTSQDGTTAGDYSLVISWKSPTAFGTTAVLAPAASSTLSFAAERGAVASIVTKPAKKSPAVAIISQLALPDLSTLPYGQAAVRYGLTSTGDYVVTFGNDGATLGGVTTAVKIKLPKPGKRKVDLTSKSIGSGNALGDAAISALFDGNGGTLTVPFIPPGQPGAEISGSAVTVPQGALGSTTTIVIATAPALAVPDASLKSVGPTVLFGPEGLKFNSLNTTATATVTIPYAPSFDGATDTFVVYTRDANGKITAVPKPYTFDHGAHTVSFATSHFSSFRAGGKDAQPQFTLNTLALLNDPRDVCPAHDPSSGLPLRYFVAGGTDNKVIALRLGAQPGPLVVPETFAGGGADPTPGTPRLQFKFVDPVTSVATLQNGQLFVATARQIFTVDGQGNVQVVAGTGQNGDGGDNGPALNATFLSISSILVTLNGQIYVCDASANRIRFIDPMNNNRITAWAGTGVTAIGTDGTDILTTTFVGPSDMAFDGVGPGLYVADGGRVRHLSPGNPLTGGGINATVAGSETGQTGNTGDDGPLLVARFTSISGIALYPDPFNTSDMVVLVCDSADHTIRKLDLTTNKVTLAAGQHGSPGFGGGIDISTGLINTPGQLMSEANDVTFVDAGNTRIRTQTLLK